MAKEGSLGLRGGATMYGELQACHVLQSEITHFVVRIPSRPCRLPPMSAAAVYDGHSCVGTCQLTSIDIEGRFLAVPSTLDVGT